MQRYSIPLRFEEPAVPGIHDSPIVTVIDEQGFRYMAQHGTGTVSAFETALVKLVVELLDEVKRLESEQEFKCRECDSTDIRLVCGSCGEWHG